ncbi:MAG: transcription antitermination factor NusB [Firmicutes bacterium]|nr:transcription antitermination factor NusB [Bacillota bacterium]
MEKPSRSELRKIIMTILYQKSIYEKNKINFTIDNLISSALEIDNEFVKDTVYGVITYQNEIDKLINKYLNNWTIDRLGYTDQAILRLATYELMYTDTPSVVAINEAILLSKQYSDDDVRKMINATLDKIYHDKD